MSIERLFMLLINNMLSHMFISSIIPKNYVLPLRSRKTGVPPPRVELPKIQKLILSSASEMLASNDDLRKSITFLTPGVKLVVKTFPSESFNLIEQLKSLDEIRNFSNSERVCTNFDLFSMISWRFSTLRIFSIRVSSGFTIFTGSGFTSATGSGTTAATGSAFISATGAGSGVGTGNDVTAGLITDTWPVSDLPLVGLRTSDNLVMLCAPCPGDLFWLLARRVK